MPISLPISPFLKRSVEKDTPLYPVSDTPLHSKKDKPFSAFRTIPHFVRKGCYISDSGLCYALLLLRWWQPVHSVLSPIQATVTRQKTPIWRLFRVICAPIVVVNNRGAGVHQIPQSLTRQRKSPHHSCWWELYFFYSFIPYTYPYFGQAWD